MDGRIVDIIKATAKAAAITTVIVGLIIIILLYATDVSLDSNLTKILCGCWIVATICGTYYLIPTIKSGGAPFMPVLPPPIESVRVNIKQLGTAYSMPMNCAPNKDGTAIDCVTDVDFLNNQVKFTNIVSAVPIIGHAIGAIVGIVSLGTEIIEKMNDIPIGTTEKIVKNKVSNTIDTIVEPINTMYNMYNKNTSKSITQ